MQALILSFALLVCAASLYAADPVSVYVFTVTNAEGFVDEESKGRADSVVDLELALTKRKFVIAEQGDGADLTLEVLVRGEIDTGKEKTDTYRQPYTGIIKSDTEKVTAMRLIVKLSTGTYEKEFTADDALVFWKGKATDIAKQVERWAKQNAATLAAR